MLNVNVVAGWCICPKCGSRTKTRVNESTVLLNFPLYCHRCKQETPIKLVQKPFRLEVMKSEANLCDESSLSHAVGEKE